MLDTLDASSVRAWAIASADALEARRVEIDELNVFPVADSDTGTNLAQTMRAAADSMFAEPGADSSAATALAALARGAVLSARGNSGVIVSQLLRGLAEGITGAPSCDAQAVRRALDRAAATAYAAVGQPTEGTILSVARAAAMASRELAVTAQLAEVVCAARDGALAALARTPQQLAVLAHAGVVDAGGRGLVVLLDALCGVITGEPSVLTTERREPNRPLPRSPQRPRDAIRETGSDEFAYEVQYLLDASELAAAALRESLAVLGDSVSMVGTGTGVWNVHVHVNDVGAAIEAGIAAGRPYRLSVTRFADQIAARGSSGSSAVIVMLPDAGLAHLFDGVGVHVVTITDPECGEDDTLAAIDSAGTSRIVLLANTDHLVGAAAGVARRARNGGVEVVVVPTRSPVQGLAAVAVHDDARRSEDDVIAMAEAAAATRFALVEIATGEGLTTIGACQAGDVLGLIDGDVVEIGADVMVVAESVLARLLGIGGELVTVIIGLEAPATAEAQLRAYLADHAPLVECVVYSGQQREGILLFGME